MTIGEKAFGRVRLIKFRGTENPLGWPKAESDKCFLLEAVNIVGHAKFGQKWSGRELLSGAWLKNPREWPLQTLLVRRPMPVPESSIASSYRFRPPVGNNLPSIDEGELEKAENEAIALWDEDRDNVARLLEVIYWLEQEFRDGRLGTFYRLETGGALAIFQPSNWNVDDSLDRYFSNGGYALKSSSRTQSTTNVYIFVDRAKLNEAVAQFGHSSPTISEHDLSCLSPYLQFAVRLALAEGYTSADKCRSAKERSNAIRGHWDAALPGVTVTNPQVDMLSDVMKWPNEAAIQAGLTGKRERKHTPPNA